MKRTTLARYVVFVVILIASCPAAGGDIVDSFDSASDKELEALFAKLVVESDASNKAILTLLRSKRTIMLGRKQMAADCVGLMLLLQRKSTGPVFYPDLLKLALDEQGKPGRSFGWLSPSRLLARKGNEELAPFLIEKLKSEDRAVKRLAILLLGKTKDKRAVAPLKRLFLVEGETAASVALYDILEKEMVPILLRACESPDAPVRRVACAHLGNIGRPGTLPVLVRLLAKDRNARVRAEAAGAMRFIKEEGAIAALTDALTDPSSLVRSKAAYTLAVYKRSDAGAHILVADLNTSVDDDMREKAAAGLIYVTTPEAEKALCRSLKEERVADARNCVALALAKHGSPICLQPLFLALTDEDDRVRRNAGKAIMAVVERHKEASLPLLKKISREVSGVAREKAESCLRKLAGPKR